MKKIGLILVFVMSFSMLESVASAEADCPKSISPDNPRATETKRYAYQQNLSLPLDQPILVEYNGEFYQIPVGYFASWPLKRHKQHSFTKKMHGADLEKVNVMESLYLAFWMPEMRYTEREASINSFRFCEDGRLPVTENQKEYVVKVIVEPIYKDFENLVAQNEGGATYNFYEEHGLLRYERKDRKDKKTYYYRHLENTEPQVWMDCSGPEEELLNPGCQGYFYFSKSKLNFRMRFSVQDLPRWREMVDATVKLLNRWKVKDEAEIERLKKTEKVKYQ